MSDLWRSFKSFYFGFSRWQTRVLSPMIVVLLFIIIVRWATTPPQGHVFTVEESEVIQFDTLDDGEILGFINAMGDTRPDKCKDLEYKKLPKHTVSIILDFNGQQFYDLKMTLESILVHTDDSLYEEIIILDDATDHINIRKDAVKYLGQERFKKIKAYRSEQAEGSSISRFKASKLAVGSILVFISSETAVNVGWLGPLVEAVNIDRKLIAVPHTDNLLQGHRFFPVADNLVNIFNWKFTTLFMETTETYENGKLGTPVMTGSIFAVEKSFLEGIGSFDEAMDNGGGDNLELSFRAWLCGGSIAIIECSRVAVHNVLTPKVTTSHKNYRRIVELWLGAYSSVVYKGSGISMDMDESERQSLKTRDSYLDKYATCKTFKEYVKSTAKYILLPPTDARFFGQVRSDTGFCLTSKHSVNGPVIMDYCRLHLYNKSLIFSLDFQGRFRHKELCVDLVDDDTVQLQACQPGRLQQRWSRTQEGYIQSSASDSLCLAHVVESSSTQLGREGDEAAAAETDRLHTAQPKPCTYDRAFKWTFLKS